MNDNVDTFICNTLIWFVFLMMFLLFVAAVS